MNEMKLIGEYLGLDGQRGPTTENEFHARRNRMMKIATTLSQSDDQEVQTIGVTLLLHRSVQPARSQIERLLKRKPQE